MPELHVLRVFIGSGGFGGNPLGVFLDGAAIPEGRRQAVAADLGFSETVFVESIDAAGRRATVRIFTPAAELPFAGHPTVGTAWLLAEAGIPVDHLDCPAGEVATWVEDERRWVRARSSWVHEFAIEELPSVEAVDAQTPPAMGAPGRYVWAWENEVQGRLRARYFATDYGILEDEATGAASVRMGYRLGRELVINQGVGSEIRVRPEPDVAPDAVAVGGIVASVETRAYEDPGAGSTA